jgi:hypothetical protein
MTVDVCGTLDAGTFCTGYHVREKEREARAESQAYDRQARHQLRRLSECVPSGTTNRSAADAAEQEKY